MNDDIIEIVEDDTLNNDDLKQDTDQSSPELMDKYFESDELLKQQKDDIVVIDEDKDIDDNQGEEKEVDDNDDADDEEKKQEVEDNQEVINVNEIEKIINEHDDIKSVSLLT